MQAELFKNLYTKQGQDETITPFQNEAGFSLIRSYPQGTKYHTDGMRMFMKVAVLNEGLFYAVDMTKPEQRGGKAEYIITGGEKYKNKVTNLLNYKWKVRSQEANMKNTM